jgi:hypothetical protein
MADRPTSRWPTVTGLWVGVATWLYAALAAWEVWDTTRDLLAVDAADLEPPPELAETLVDWTVMGLGLALVVAAVSLMTGRARRIADLVLAVGLALGAVLLWAAGEPVRPVAPVVVGLVAAAVAVSTVLPQRPAEGRIAGFLARLVLATVALLLGWVCARELAEVSWDVDGWSATPWSGLVVAVLMLLAVALGPLLGRPVARWLFGLPTVLVGLAGLVVGVLGLREGRLLTGFEEVEPGWWLGGPAVYLGAGLTAGGLALLRGRPTLALGTVATAVLTTAALLLGISEIRSGF